MIRVDIEVPGKNPPTGNGWEEDYFLSPAPQAVPQAAGFSSGFSAAPQAAGASAGFSAAPQAAGVSAGFSAAPQAAGVSAGLSAAPQAAGASAGLSAAPQAAGASAGLSAAPQAAAGAFCSSSFLPHPNRLESAIVLSSLDFVRALIALCNYNYTDDFRLHKYALFCKYIRTFL